jgi:lysophospholipase L1-like esterase
VACAAVWRLGGIRYLFFLLMHNPVPAQYHHTADYYQHATDLEKAPVTKRVVLMGDSHIEYGRWSELLRGSSFDAVNRGIAGDYILGVAARLTPIKLLAPDILVLQVGVNDLFFKSATAAIADYRDLLDTLTAGFTQIPIVVHKILPVNNSVRRTGVSNEDIAAFNAELEQLVKNYPQVVLVDMSTQLTDNEGLLKSDFTRDGIHLSGRAYLIWGQQLTGVLTRLLREG